MRNFLSPLGLCDDTVTAQVVQRSIKERLWRMDMDVEGGSRRLF